MEKFNLSLLVFFAVAVCTANSFKCYSCGPKKDDESYTTAQCEKDQKEVECNFTAGMTCMKGHSTMTDDKEVEVRSCTTKEVCEIAKKGCESKDAKEKAKIKECQVACCETDLCNSAFIFSGSIAMMMTAAMFSLVLF